MLNSIQKRLLKKEDVCFFRNQICLFPKTDLKVLPQCSNNPIVSSFLLPLLFGLPVNFQVFLGVLTSIPHLGHLAKKSPSYNIGYDRHKTFSSVKLISPTVEFVYFLPFSSVVFVTSLFCNPTRAFRSCLTKLFLSALFCKRFLPSSLISQN